MLAAAARLLLPAAGPASGISRKECRSSLLLRLFSLFVRGGVTFSSRAMRTKFWLPWPCRRPRRCAASGLVAGPPASTVLASRWAYPSAAIMTAAATGTREESPLEPAWPGAARDAGPDVQSAPSGATCSSAARGSSCARRARAFAGHSSHARTVPGMDDRSRIRCDAGSGWGGLPPRSFRPYSWAFLSFLEKMHESPHPFESPTLRQHRRHLEQPAFGWQAGRRRTHRAPVPHGTTPWTWRATPAARRRATTRIWERCSKS